MVPCLRMTLPPNSPAATPAGTQPTQKPRRKRCMNCNKLFDLKKPWQKFCGYQCQRQFHHYGNSYGKLKETLTKLIREQVKELAPSTIETMVSLQISRLEEALSSRIESVEDRTRRIALQLAAGAK